MSHVDSPRIEDWRRAVSARDATWDGRFVYGVTSTSIFCRPSCPSRRPRADRIRFFVHPGQAADAGFRACKRCLPDSFDPRIASVVEVCRLIEEHSDGAIELRDLAAATGLSATHLQKSFKSLLGVTPRQYGAMVRRNGFERLLRQGVRPTEAVYEAGYGSARSAYENAAEHYGMTPATYGAKGKGATICYAISDSPLGKMLVAATDNGVCAIRFGASHDELVAALRGDFSQALISKAQTKLRVTVSKVMASLNGRAPDLRLPLDIRTTAFQRLVWQELQRIPVGETRSYSEVANSVGRPKAARAVARVCASNSVALAIPCHRVVRENGDAGGYRWGVERKQQILEYERQISDNRKR